MMQDVQVKLNTELPRQKRHATRRHFTGKLELINLRTKRVKCYIWSIALCDAENWTLRKVDQKYLEGFEMWYWRRTVHVKNEEVLHNPGGEEYPTYNNNKEG